MNYRKLYTEQIGKIPYNWDIHHIDFNHDNNNIDNLIAVPKIVHKVIHQTGYLERKEIEDLIEKCILLYKEGNNDTKRKTK